MPIAQRPPAAAPVASHPRNAHCNVLICAAAVLPGVPVFAKAEALMLRKAGGAEDQAKPAAVSISGSGSTLPWGRRSSG